MKDLYRPLQQEEDTTLIITDLEAAELIKYASNAFLATKISFINEIANLCDKIGCDVKDVAKGMGLDKRIGPHFLHPGPGYGGSCFPKDTSALVAIAKHYESETRIVKAVMDVNKCQREEMVKKIKSLVGDLKGKTVGILGLAFKPETDDMREAPAIDIIHQLVDDGAIVRAYDPVAMEEAEKVLPPIIYVTDELAAAAGADVLVVMTEWRHFYNLDMAEIKKRMRSPKLADLRNVFKPQEMRDLGFEYVGVGRNAKKANIKQTAV
jgi:UDPglucose 6-dehydrogenase